MTRFFLPAVHVRACRRMGEAAILGALVMISLAGAPAEEAWETDVGVSRHHSLALSWNVVVQQVQSSEGIISQDSSMPILRTLTRTHPCWTLCIDPMTCLA